MANQVHPTVKELPPGWRIDTSKTGKDGRIAVILCERIGDPTGTRGTQFVVWKVNLSDGGCYLGFYTDDRVAADRNFAERNPS